MGGGTRGCLFRKRETGHGAGEESQKAPGPPMSHADTSLQVTGACLCRRTQRSQQSCPGCRVSGGPPHPVSHSVIPNADVTVTLLMEEVDSEEGGE